MLTLFLYSFLSFLNPPHDIAMAVFAITMEENTIQLKIQLDRGDIEEVLKIDGQAIDENTQKVAEYIAEKSNWIINNKSMKFDFNTIRKDKDFYYLEAIPIKFDTPITTLDLHNTCLIEEVNKHSNIIYVKQKGKKMRGFRMSEKRTQISVEL